MNRSTVFLVCIYFETSFAFPLNAQDIIQQSRANCVLIESASAKSSGTGFFLDDQHIATCFHVVANIAVSGTIVHCQIYQDLRVVLASGDTIGAVCISLPTNQDRSPLSYDFAILRVSSKQSSAFQPNSLAKSDAALVVGSEVIFSGYPLATPAMVTHKGMISGISKDRNIICIQSAINKGNSGCALLNSTGEVIGIVSMREGGITQGLMKLSRYIDSTAKQGNVTIMGVDPLQSTKDIINVLDTYISTGIGYAIAIKHLREYINRHPLN